VISRLRLKTRENGRRKARTEKIVERHDGRGQHIVIGIDGRVNAEESTNLDGDKHVPRSVKVMMVSTTYHVRIIRS